MFLILFLLAPVFAEQQVAKAPVQDIVADPSSYTAYYDNSLTAYGAGGYGTGYEGSYGKDRYDGDYGYYGLSYGYGDKEEYPKVIGRHGLAFEKRTSRASGLREPITPEALQHIGYRPTRKEIQFVPLQAGYLL